jgi:hypothetical protein
VADSEPIRLSDSQRLDWLRLIRSENVGPRTFRSLVNHCGGAGAALAALPEFARRGGAARPPRICSREEAEQEIAAAARIGVCFVALGEADYPPHLQVVDDAPPLLAIRGDAAVLHGPLVAMVGSRNASAAGVKMAERLARDLGADGFGVVSGLARGIDAAARWCRAEACRDRARLRDGELGHHAGILMFEDVAVRHVRVLRARRMREAHVDLARAAGRDRGDILPAGAVGRGRLAVL